MIDLNSPVPLYRQVAEDIRARIDSGEYKVGEQVGSQQELSRRYNVSPITVKKAVADLIREGVLFSRVGKGTYVAQPQNHIDYSGSPTIGFVLRDLNSPFFSRILTSVERAAYGNRYNLLLANSSNQADVEESQIEHFLNLGVNGIIIASMSHRYTASPPIRNLERGNFPYVLVSYIVDEDICFVGTDHEQGGYIATEHLIRLGYTRIGYIDGEEGNRVGELRQRGYLQALAHYDLAAHPEDVYRLGQRGEWRDYESGYEIGDSFASLASRSEAVFVYNDLAALGFQRAVLDAGLKVPADVAIVGFDDITQGLTAPVPLTTIHQPTEEIGKLAVNTLIRKINNEVITRRRILAPTLVVRNSCGAGNGQDR